ncbi:MAG: hypothetical protein SVT52_04535 [Planctomycetota bacterium]|nr:hypothetical protein [Planctomycetota bacterium]
MRLLQTYFAVVLVALAAAVALAQEAAPMPMPKPEPIISHIPAGTMGFVVVNDVQATTEKVESFLKEIGLAPMLGISDETPGMVLAMLKGAAMLGEGFNAQGGFAAVMLDPQQFGVDLIQMMMPDMAATQPDEKPKVPFVLFVPGTGVKEVFGNYPCVEAENYTKVSLRMGEMFAAKCGGYVILSPTPKALDAVLQAEQKAATELTGDEAELLVRSDIGAWVNMKTVAPIYSTMLDKFQEQMARPGMMGPPKFLASVFPFYKTMIAQMQSVAVGGRFVETGLVFEEAITFLPDSNFAKAMAEAKTSTAKELLNRLPNLPYVLAFGAVGNTSEQEKEMTDELLDKLLADESMAEVPEETKAKIKELAIGFNEQVTGAQLVGGGAPEGSGLFGLAYVIQCKDAETVKGMLADSAAVTETLIKSLVDDEDAQQLKISYIEAADTAGEAQVDAISITHPELAEMDEEDKAEMKKVLGEDGVRLLIAAADENAVVVTFGGSQAFMAEALKTAAGGGTIPAGEELAEALKYMPDKPTGIMLLNVGNLFDVILKGTRVMQDNEEAMLPIQITTKTPIAIGAGVQANAVRVVAYVPNKLIQEAVGAAMMFMMPQPAMPAGGEPTQGGEDF